MCPVYASIRSVYGTPKVKGSSKFIAPLVTEHTPFHKYSVLRPFSVEADEQPLTVVVT